MPSGRIGQAPGDGVVEDALHAVSVARIARHSHEVARDLEVRVGATRGFEAGMCFLQTLVKPAAARRHEGFIGAPAAGGESFVPGSCENHLWRREGRFSSPSTRYDCMAELNALT